MEKTNALRLLEQKKAKYIIHEFANFTNGMDIAIQLNEDPSLCFKTLVTVGKSKNHYVFLVPVNKELNLKKAAKATNEKYIEMVKAKDLLPLTGYIHGGCSPIGMKKQFKTFIDISIQNKDKIYLSGGKVGLQIETSLEDLSKVITFTLIDLID